MFIVCCYKLKAIIILHQYADSMLRSYPATICKIVNKVGTYVRRTYVLSTSYLYLGPQKTLLTDLATEDTQANKMEKKSLPCGVSQGPFAPSLD